MSPEKEKKVATNVVSLFAAKAKLEEQKSEDVEKKSAESEISKEEIDFAEEVRRNKEIADRMKKERQKANRSVLRSYRLKT